MIPSIDDKQKSLYVAIIRYSSDAQSLRDRAVDHLVLIALQDTSSESFESAGKLGKIIGKGVGTEGLRIEIIQESLKRLIKLELCSTKKVRNKNQYFISSIGQNRIKEIKHQSDDLINPCIDRILSNYNINSNKQDEKLICKKFIINCFVKYGQQMASGILGKIQHKNMSSIIDAKSTFIKSINGFKISKQAEEDLYIRCQSFIKSNNSEDIELKLLLSQAFYLAKVLEIDNKEFDPLVESAFSEAIIYLDSNVVFQGLMDIDNTNLFVDLITIATSLNISLCVTQETINEINRVLASKVAYLNNIVTKLPSKLYKGELCIINNFS